MRPLGSSPAITDGPFAETKETVGGSLEPISRRRAHAASAMSAAVKRLRKSDPPALAPADKRFRPDRCARADKDVYR